MAKKKKDPIDVVKQKFMVSKDILVDATKKQTKEKIDVESVEALVKETGEKLNDVYGIMEIVPETKLVGEILVSTVLSPKDLHEVEFKLKSNLKISASYADCVSKYMRDKLNMSGMLPEILRESLFTKGSKPIVTIPTTQIRKLIEESTVVNDTESLIPENGDVDVNRISNRLTRSINDTGNIGLINTNRKQVVDLESINKDNFINYGDADGRMIDISDNFSHILKPKVDAAMKAFHRKQILKGSLGMDLEDLSEENELSVYVEREFTKEVKVRLENSEEPPVHAPVTIYWPHESTFPIVDPSNPKENKGALLAIDAKDGMPISKAEDSSYFKELNERLRATLEAGNDSDAFMRKAFGDAGSGSSSADIKESFKDMFMETIEKEIHDAVKDSTGEHIEVGEPEHLYNIMLYRVLKKKRTRLIYVPPEMFSYIAFNRNSMGVGIGLVEKNRFFSSLRAVSMISRMIGGVRRSVPGKLLNITLDPNDSDQNATVEYLINTFNSLQTESFPQGLTSPVEIARALQKSGVQVNIDGGETFPGTKMEVEDKQVSGGEIDDDLEEMLKKWWCAGYYISPEQIDRTLESDFATGITSSDLLAAKRIMVLQQEFIQQMSSHVHVHTALNGVLLKELEEIRTKEKETKHTLREIIQSLELVLPSAGFARIQAQIEDLGTFSELIDEAIEWIFSTDISDGKLDGDFTDDMIDGIQAAAKGILIRDYMREHNILPEIFQLIDNDLDVLATRITDHDAKVVKLVEIILPTIRKIEIKADRKTNKKLDKLEEEPEEEPEEGAEVDGGDVDPDATDDPVEGEEVTDEGDGDPEGTTDTNEDGDGDGDGENPPDEGDDFSNF